MITPQDSASHSRSLPRHVTPEMLWPQRHPNVPAPDNLSRVARWVESVSTQSPDPTHQQPTAIPCCKHPVRQSSHCKNCGQSSMSFETPKSPELVGRGSSAPAARYRAHHGPLVFRSIEETQQQASPNPPSDPRKPDGASDPGIHRDRSFGSEGPKTSPMRKPVLRRFADLFVCSPGTSRHSTRQHHQIQQTAPQAPVSKMCVPFFGGKGPPSSQHQQDGDLLSIDSAGMLFTSLSKEGEEEVQSLFCDVEQQTARQGASGGEKLPAEKHCDDGPASRLRIKVRVDFNIQKVERHLHYRIDALKMCARSRHP